MWVEGRDHFPQVKRLRAFLAGQKAVLGWDVAAPN
jgi:hypothetical protein